jgi:D-alanyl-D-alanine carboxypeptidase
MNCRCREMKYGHDEFAAATGGELVEVGPYRQTGRMVTLRVAAAEALRRLMTAAGAEHIDLIPISGFRSVDGQRALFLKAVRKYGSENEAAKWVAPPGFSEHHTGLAVDLGDGAAPDTDVETGFETTEAFRWLKRHGTEFGFVLSFPRDNPRGVAYEPWHWKYVGTAEAQHLFPAERTDSPVRAPDSSAR